MLHDGIYCRMHSSWSWRCLYYLNDFVEVRSAWICASNNDLMVLPFLVGSRLKRLPEILIQINSWLKHFLGELSRFISWLKHLPWNRLAIQAGSPGIDSNQLMTRELPWESNQIDSTKNLSLFGSNQLMTQAKNMRFWVDSWFDSESYPCLWWWSYFLNFDKDFMNCFFIVNWLGCT